MATDLDMGLDGHTPGPWVADFHNEQREGGRFITYVRGGNQLVPIAAVPTGVEGYGREEGRANARLIAASPQFAEAAPDAVEILDRYASFIRDWVKAEDLEMHPYLPQIELVADYLREIIAKIKAPSRA